MRVWLIRHGVTALGEAGKYQGRLDDGLSERGRAQLKSAAWTPSRVWVSPARRARETAAILFPAAEQIIVPNLREMDFGAFEGRSWQEMENDTAYRAWVDGGCAGRCPGGEDRASFTARVNLALREILDAAEKAGEDAVIVAHGGTQMAALASRGEPGRDYWRWQTACGRGWLLERCGDTLRVVEEIAFTL